MTIRIQSLSLALACATAAWAAAATPERSAWTTPAQPGEALAPAAPALAAATGPAPSGRLAPREGWPVDLGAPGNGFPYTPTLVDLDGDGADEILVTGGHTFGLRGDGGFLPGWPTTEHLYMGYGTNAQKPGPAASDLEDDGDVETLWSQRDWWAGSSEMWCFNGRELDGSDLPGFPQFAPDDYSNALDVPFVLGDADGDGFLEAWGPHSLGNAFVHYRLSAFDHLGTRRFTRDVWPTHNMLDLHFGDLNGDGADEFFATAWLEPQLYLYAFAPDGADLPGFPIVLRTLAGGYLPFGPPVPADLDGDGDLEFLVGYNQSGTSRVEAAHHDGADVAGFPVTVATGSQLFYVSLGDLTGDGTPELLALDNHLGGNYRGHAFDLATGLPLAGWPVDIPHWPHGFPCVADLDGDGFQDLAVSTDGGQVLAFDRGGATLAGFPLAMAGSSISSVAAGDIDGDGLFEIVSATWGGLVYAWDMTGPALPGRADWPLRGINPRYTGIYGDLPTATGVASGPAADGGALRVLANPARGRAEFALAGARAGALEIFDVRGRRVARIAAAADGRAVWRPAAGIGSGVYLIRAASGDAPPAKFVLLR